MVPYENLSFMITGVLELQTDVEEVTAFKRTSRFGTQTGKKRKALLAEEEDIVDDYISDSSRTNNVADDEPEEGNS
jgi:hypothetical protein